MMNAEMVNNANSSDENAQPPFKLTISEYEEIASRHEKSLKQLVLVRSALETPKNLETMRERIERECELMTMRVTISKHEKTNKSVSKPGIVTDIFRC